MVKAVYFQTRAGNVGASGGIIQTIVKTGLLKFGNVAHFLDGIPAYYEFYYNGQWYQQGELGEEKLDNITFTIPGMNWAVDDDLQMKYQIIV
jgi:hypothetical protein